MYGAYPRSIQTILRECDHLDQQTYSTTELTEDSEQVTNEEWRQAEEHTAKLTQLGGLSGDLIRNVKLAEMDSLLEANGIELGTFSASYFKGALLLMHGVPARCPKVISLQLLPLKPRLHNHHHSFHITQFPSRSAHGHDHSCKLDPRTALQL